jgi:hypothetical protein
MDWMPVILVTIIIVGAVGGQLAQMVLKELLPLLRTLAEQKRLETATPADMKRVLDALTSMDERLARLERGQERLESEREFARQLRGPSGTSAELE